MRCVLLALVLGIFGCGGPVLVSVVSTRDIGRASDDPSAHVRELLDEAFGAWGLAWAPSDSIAGAVELTLTGFDDASEVHGFNVRSGRCDRSITVEPDALLLAHEVGHVFGVADHDRQPGRVMSHPVLGWDVTDSQLQRVQADADRFSRCRR